MKLGFFQNNLFFALPRPVASSYKIGLIPVISAVLHLAATVKNEQVFSSFVPTLAFSYVVDEQIFPFLLLDFFVSDILGSPRPWPLLYFSHCWTIVTDLSVLLLTPSCFLFFLMSGCWWFVSLHL